MSSKLAEQKDVIALPSARTAKATTSRSRYSFGARFRLRKKKDFASVQCALERTGKRLYSKHFLILVAPTNLERSRLGVTVTTKIDKRAVQRNRLKRCIREVFRLSRLNFTRSIDMVVIARNDSNRLSFEEISFELSSALRRSGFLK